MATLRLSTISLMLSIVLWGTLLGGIAYSHLVFFPPYLSALPDSAVIVNGPYGLQDATFWTIIHPPLILSLLVSLLLNWKLRARRKLVLISLVVYVLMLAISLIYFVPELMAFQRSPESGLSPAEWLARGQRWQRLSWIRGAVCYVGFMPLLLALTKPAEGNSDQFGSSAPSAALPRVGRDVAYPGRRQLLQRFGVSRLRRAQY